MSVIIKNMQGLGDNISSRPFIRALAAREDLYLKTPWPQLFQDDRNVKCLPWGSKMRTQQKNEARGYTWHKPPGYPCREIVMQYGSATMRKGSLHDEIERLLPLNGAPYVHDLPSFGRSPVQADKPVAVVRPVTIRKEWSAAARNCLPEYPIQAAEILQGLGYHVVTLADTQPGQEWLVGDAPPADTQYLDGELIVERMMALIEHAAIVVTPVGFLVHAAMAYKRPTIVVAGGRGQHCAPWKETDPRQDHSRLRWMVPDVFCMCDIPEHDCPKIITDFRNRFSRTVAAIAPAAQNNVSAPLAIGDAGYAETMFALP